MRPGANPLFFFWFWLKRTLVKTHARRHAFFARLSFVSRASSYSTLCAHGTLPYDASDLDLDLDLDSFCFRSSDLNVAQRNK